MAYCPRCDREQRCGCDICHECGTRLIEAGPREPGFPGGWNGSARSALSGSEVRARDRGGDDRWAAPPPVGAATEAGGRPAISIALVILGAGLLLTAVISMVYYGLEITPSEGPRSLAAVLQRVGYFLGHLLYRSVTGVIAGIALITVGLLIDSPASFEDRDSWETVVRGFAILSLALGALFLFSCGLLLIPGGYQGLYVSNLLPPLWNAVPVLAAAGASLSAAGYVVLVRSNTMPARTSGKEAEALARVPNEKVSRREDGNGVRQRSGGAS